MRKNMIDYLRNKIGRYTWLRKALMPINNIIRKKDEKRMNEHFRRCSDSIFHLIYETLSEANVEFWPEFGTLLGIYRENDFLKHDLDFDFGAFEENNTLIHSLLTKAGFVLKHKYEGINHPEIKEVSYEYNGVGVDFFYFLRGTEKDRCHTFILSDAKMNPSNSTYKVKVFTFDKITLKDYFFKGRTIQVPSDTKEHLIVSYGPSFMIPDKKFKSINNAFLEGIYAKEYLY